MNKLENHLCGARFGASKFGIRIVVPVFLSLAASWFGGEALAADNTFTLVNTSSSRNGAFRKAGPEDLPVMCLSLFQIRL